MVKNLLNREKRERKKEKKKQMFSDGDVICNNYWETTFNFINALIEEMLIKFHHAAQTKCKDWQFAIL